VLVSREAEDMEIRAREDVGELLRGSIVSAGLGAALEHRLFWRLKEKPTTSEAVAKELGIPPHRCRAWLDLLVGLGLLGRQDEVYGITEAAQTAILDTHSPESWALLAQEARADYPAGDDLTRHIEHPGSVWEALGRDRRDHYGHMSEDADWARRFTQMLYEYHQSLAEELGDTLDMTGVERLMDLGGGSGVNSLALLHRHPAMEAVVVDVATVCAAGRAIAAKTNVSERVTYHPADFLADELPAGFDLILESDVGIHNVDLFRKLRGSLNPDGRLVIVDDLMQKGVPTPFPWLRQAFLVSLRDPDARIRSAADVKDALLEAGYEIVNERTLEGGVLIEARL
jgi:SAM-dependent methyltransferase